MSRFFLLIIFIVTSFFTVQAQLIISDKIDFANPDQTHVLWTVRGDQLRGRLLTLEQDSLSFQLQALTDNVLRYHRREVRFVGLAGEAFPNFSSRRTTNYRDPLHNKIGFPRQNLLYSATALAPENKGYYRNTMVLINDAELNLDEHFSVGAGVIIPSIVILRARARTSINSFVHVGLNVNNYTNLFYFPENYTHPYAILTLGNEDKYINFTYGRWIQSGDYVTGNFPIISIGGSYTLSDKWRIFFEGMLFEDNFDSYFLPTGSCNYLRRRSMYGFGIWGLPGESIIPFLPWASYSLLF